MDIKIKINNIEPNELKDGGIGRRVKESMVELYYNILDKSKWYIKVVYIGRLYISNTW